MEAFRQTQPPPVWWGLKLYKLLYYAEIDRAEGVYQRYAAHIALEGDVPAVFLGVDVDYGGVFVGYVHRIEPVVEV